MQAKLAAAGVTTAQLSQAIADAMMPGSAQSVNTGKLDIDTVYGAVPSCGPAMASRVRVFSTAAQWRVGTIG